MKLKFLLLMLWCAAGLTVNAQSFLKIGLNIGDTVPPLKIKEWVKGKPIEDFEKDKIYIVEFWATWCVPCMLSMPHLSELARKYQDKITVLAVDIYEKENTQLAKIKKLVDTMGTRMDFPVGIEEGNFMAKNWIDTSEARSIPTTFIIKDRKIEWIGHPQYLDSVLTRILNKTWDRKFALLKRNDELYLGNLERIALDILGPKTERYVVNIPGNTYNRVKLPQDSILMIIDDMVKNIPSLKFLPTFASVTFEALLKTDMQKAYEYARAMMVWGDEPSYDVLIQNIEENPGKLQIPENIYRLGAECYQAQIDDDRFPELGLIPVRYKKMAKLYRLAGDLEKAAEAEQKAESRAAKIVR